MKKHSNNKPCIIEGNIIRYNIIENITKQDNDQSITSYEYNELVVSAMNYASIVSAIIRDKYSADAVEAILLNGSDTEEHANEYNKLQEYRIFAKNTAKEILAASKNEIGLELKTIKDKLLQTINHE